MYRPKSKVAVTEAAVASAPDDVDVSALFDQVYVDAELLAEGVRSALRRERQVGLGRLVEAHPLAHGLAELVTYLSLSDPAFEVVFDEQVRESVTWQDDENRTRVATLPRVTFTRRAHERGIDG